MQPVEKGYKKFKCLECCDWSWLGMDPVLLSLWVGSSGWLVFLL